MKHVAMENSSPRAKLISTSFRDESSGFQVSCSWFLAFFPRFCSSAAVLLNVAEQPLHGIGSLDASEPPAMLEDNVRRVWFFAAPQAGHSHSHGHGPYIQ